MPEPVLTSAPVPEIAPDAEMSELPLKVSVCAPSERVPVKARPAVFAFQVWLVPNTSAFVIVWRFDESFEMPKLTAAACNVIALPLSVNAPAELLNPIELMLHALPSAIGVSRIVPANTRSAVPSLGGAPFGFQFCCDDHL